MAIALGALLASIIPLFGEDTVGVYTPDFKRVFADARTIKVSVKEASKLMEHPLETGAETTDHRIILQTEIELSLILEPTTYKAVYAEIKQLWKKGTLLTVQSRTDIYENQLIQDMPHDEDANLFDTIAIGLKLKEVQFVKPQFSIVPRNKNRSSTVDRGTQQAKPASNEQTAKSSAAFKIFK